MAENRSEQIAYRLNDLPPLADLTRLYSPAELAAIRTRHAQLRPHETADVAIDPATLASIAIGFAPGSGFTDILGWLPDFENGGYHPSLLANLKRGDIRTAGWQTLGGVGDALYLAPAVGVPLGIAAKAPRAAQFGRWAKYAEKYPEAGPPRLYDKATSREISVGSLEEAQRLVAQKKAYWGRGLTRDVEAFARDRRLIQRDMDRNGFTPYFDPAKRADVDPKNYPTGHDMSVEAVPVRPETMQKYQSKYGTEEAIERLAAAYSEGKKLQGSKDSLALKQVEDKYIEMLGPRVGRDLFKQEFVGPIAATTAGNSPTRNFIMAHYVALENKAGRRLPKHSYEVPYPVDGPYTASNLKASQAYFDNGSVGFDASNPKRHDFMFGMLGHRDRNIVDRRFSRALVPGMQAPRYYGPASQAMNVAIERVGARDAREFGDPAWAALAHSKHKPEGPFIDVVNESIERTHRLTGMPRDKIVELGLILKKIPMYGIGGATIAPMAGYGLRDSTSDNNWSTRAGSL